MIEFAVEGGLRPAQGGAHHGILGEETQFAQMLKSHGSHDCRRSGQAEVGFKAPAEAAVVILKTCERRAGLRGGHARKMETIQRALERPGLGQQKVPGFRKGFRSQHHGGDD